VTLTLDEYLDLLEEIAPFSRSEDPLTIAFRQASERTAVEIESQRELSAISWRNHSAYPFNGWVEQASQAAELTQATLLKVEEHYVAEGSTEEGRRFFLPYLEEDAKRLRKSIALYENLGKPFNSAQAPLVALISDFSADGLALFIDDEAQIESLKLIQRLRDEYFFTLEFSTLVQLVALISTYIELLDYDESQLEKAHRSLDQLETFIMLTESKLT